MPLTLKPVEAGHGSRWVGDAFRLFARRPMAFTLLALAYFVLAMLMRLLPLLGALLPLAAMPLLSLGFMIAAQSALLDGPVHPRQFVEPLLTDKPRRLALLKLCLGYAVAMVVVMILADSVSDEAWSRMQALDPKRPDLPAQMELLLPALGRGMAVLALLGTLVSVPFWHAPALVHWGRQGAKQALFSSTVAMWRTRGALFIYLAAWTGLVLLMALAAAILMGALGQQQPPALLLLPLSLVLSAVFYISTLFCFNDTFGHAPDPVAEEPRPPR